MSHDHPNEKLAADLRDLFADNIEGITVVSSAYGTGTTHIVDIEALCYELRAAVNDFCEEMVDRDIAREARPNTGRELRDDIERLTDAANIIKTIGTL